MSSSASFQNRILNFFFQNFKSMPKWLKNLVIIAVIIAFLYFGVFQHYIYNNVYYTNIQYLQEDIDQMQVKINKIESQQTMNAEMIDEIIEIRSIMAAQYDYQIKLSSIMEKRAEERGDIKEYMNLEKNDSLYKSRFQEIIDKSLKKRLNQ